MPPDTLFTAGNVLVIPFWLLLAALPRWRGTQLAAGFLVPALVAAAYGVLLLSQLGAGGSGGFGSVSAVQQLFANPYLLLAGWYHYLAFDLFVGGWQTRDAVRLALPIWLRLPCLVLTLFFGPLGLLLYLVVRAVTRRERHSSSPENPAVRMEKRTEASTKV